MKFPKYIFKTTLVLSILLIPIMIYATSPPSIKWLQKNSPNFKLIYPKEYDSMTDDILSYLETIKPIAEKGFTESTKKIPIILHSQTMISNGFVSLAPRRSEFFLMSPPHRYTFLGNNAWSKTLSLHEYRHVAQLETAKKSPLLRPINTLFGEYIVSGFIYSLIPTWFLEGDAVAFETTYSNYGRGIESDFNRLIRMNAKENPDLTYSIQTLGSYNYITPSVYQIGYLYTSYLKKNYGIYKYNNIFKNTFKFKYQFNKESFEQSLYLETGLSLKELNTLAINDVITPHYIISTKEKEKKTIHNTLPSDNYINYYFPKQLSNNKIIAYKTSQTHLSSFSYIHKDKQDVNIFEPGTVLTQEFIAATKDYLSWIEIVPHPRWDNINYGIINILDLNTNHIIKKTKRSFYSNVDISPDQSTIIALKNHKDNTMSLDILDLHSLKRKQSIKLEKAMYSYVHFTDVPNEVLYLKTIHEKKQIIILDLTTLNKKVLYETYENIGKPIKSNNKLYCSLSYQNNDRIVQIDPQKKQRHIIIESPYGSFYPNTMTEKTHLIFNDFTDTGFNIYSTQIKTNPNTLIHYNTLKKHTNDIPYTHKKYKSKPFRLWNHSINPILWYPQKYTVSSKNGLERFSYSILSQDIMDQIRFQYTYDRNFTTDKTNHLLTLILKKYYPILYFSNIYTDYQSFQSNNTSTYEINWNEKGYIAGINIPLTFVKNKQTLLTQFDTSYTYKKLSDYNIVDTDLIIPQTKSHLSYLLTEATIINTQKQAKRMVAPKWKQKLIVQNYSMVQNSDFTGYNNKLSLNLYFPGFNQTHSFQTKWIQENQSTQDYIFNDTILTINQLYHQYLFKSYQTIGISYEYPWKYPDYNINNIINIQRIRVSHFFENTHITTETNSDQLMYIGNNVHFDVNILNINMLFEFILTMYYSQTNNYTNIDVTNSIPLGYNITIKPLNNIE